MPAEGMERLREVVAKATPGKWALGRKMPWVVDMGSAPPNPPYAVCYSADGSSEPNAAHIVLADRLARILADPGTVEKLAQVVRQEGSITSGGFGERGFWFADMDALAATLLEWLASQALAEQTDGQ